MLSVAGIQAAQKVKSFKLLYVILKTSLSVILTSNELHWSPAISYVFHFAEAAGVGGGKSYEIQDEESIL